MLLENLRLDLILLELLEILALQLALLEHLRQHPIRLIITYAVILHVK